MKCTKCQIEIDDKYIAPYINKLICLYCAFDIYNVKSWVGLSRNDYNLLFKSSSPHGQEHIHYQELLSENHNEYYCNKSK